MSSGLLAIGAFSRASSISVRTLRNYHEAGLLVPASIDPATGYRSYTADQLLDAQQIVRLRALDLPLADVHRILVARDPEVTRSILRAHEQVMRQRLEDTEQIVASLQHDPAIVATPVHTTRTTAIHILATRATVPSIELFDWLSASARDLIATAGPNRADGTPVAALYTAALTDETAEDVTVFVELSQPILVADDHIFVGEIPAQRWASLTHTGGFDTIADTYRLLGEWVAHHQAPHPDRPICERYLTIERTSRTDAQIEIRWPLAEPQP